MKSGLDCVGTPMYKLEISFYIKCRLRGVSIEVTVVHSSSFHMNL